MFGLNEKTIQQINSVFGSFPEINKVILYGSRAKGNYRINSDIDLTIIGEISFSQLLKIELLLDDLLLPYKIDLSNYKNIDNPELKNHINRVGIDFYSKET